MLAAVIIATTVLGSNVQTVGATVVDAISSSTVDNSGSDSGNTDENQGTTLANGMYKIANKALKVGTDTNSAIRNYLDTNSIVTVKDGKITVTMRYNEAGLKTI